MRNKNVLGVICRSFWKIALVIAIAAALMGLDILAVQPSPQAVAKYSGWSTPVNLGPTINSASDDALPSLSKDGLSLYFTSNRPEGVGGFDNWVSQRGDVNAPWGPPVNLGAVVNSVADDAGPALSRDGHWLLFHSTRAGGLGGFDLMASWRQHTNDDFGWQTPVNLAVLNSAGNDVGATYFEGEEGGTAELYFGSNRQGGIGLVDIYVSHLSADGTFGPPVLVPELSSPLNDQRPAISHDGREIFFHSNRLGSVADSNDIWVSTRPTVFDPWTTPVNVEEINTAASETQPTISSDNMTLIITSGPPGRTGLEEPICTFPPAPSCEASVRCSRVRG